MIAREFINPAASRSGLDRCLRRHDVSNLKSLRPEGDEKAAKKTFKDYEPGFIHIDIKYLPKMPDDSERRYLFVAIDRATRWGFLHVYDKQTDSNAVDFLHRVKKAAPMNIVKILTNNGSQAAIFVFNGVAQAVAGGIKVGVGRSAPHSRASAYTTASSLTFWGLMNCSRDTPSHMTRGLATSTEE